MTDDFILNNEILHESAIVDGKRASVMDHVSEALQSKFKDHPDILSKLFWIRPSQAETIGSWSAIGNLDRPQRGNGSLKLASGPSGEEQSYVVRFVGDPITFYKYVVAGKSAICADPNTCPVKKKYNMHPAMRHAVNLINRADGRLYLAEFSPAAMIQVSTWAKRRQQNPGGLVAVDFSISVSGFKKYTKYEVVPLDPSTLSKEEQMMLQYDLVKLFSPTPEAEIEAKLFGLVTETPNPNRRRGTSQRGSIQASLGTSPANQLDRPI